MGYARLPSSSTRAILPFCMECIFCGIARKEIPAEIVREDERTVAFLDIHPRAPGHTVVVPRQHSPTLLELPDGEIGLLFSAVKYATRLLANALHPSGFTIGINHGSVSGQTVDHLHVHILPRFLGDGGGSIHSVVTNPPQESLAAVAAKIRSALDQ